MDKMKVSTQSKALYLITNIKNLVTRITLICFVITSTCKHFLEEFKGAKTSLKMHLLQTKDPVVKNTSPMVKTVYGSSSQEHFSNGKNSLRIQ